MKSKLFRFTAAIFGAYASRFLASFAQGTRGFIGMAKETTWGSGVAATDYMEAMSENLSTSIERFPTRNIFGGYYEPDDSPGMSRSAGGIVTFGHPVSVGHMLKAIFNNCSQSVVLSGSLFRNNFISTKSEFAYGVPRQPYTLEINRDVTSSHRYVGAVANRMTLTLAPNQDLRASVEWIAKGRSLIAATTPTFPGSSIEPFTFDTASVQIGGAATSRVEALTVTIDNQLEGVPALNNSNEIARIHATGPQMLRISGTMDFADVTEEQDFINQTERTLKVSVTKAASFQMTLDVPRFQYTAYPMGTPGRGRTTVAFEGQARYSQTSGCAALIQLTTIKSNY